MCLKTINENRIKDNNREFEVGSKQSMLLELSGLTHINTYVQWQELEYQVNKGEKGAIKLKAPKYRKNKETGELEISGYPEYTYFDIKQVHKMNKKEKEAYLAKKAKKNKRYYKK